MEVKVWYEGMPRVVCGVTESTTCHDVILALASATGHTGRYTLVERWRSGESERNMAPQECPVTALEKYGEYASDVQFVLRRLPSTGTSEEKPASQSPQMPPFSNGGHDTALPTRHAGIRRSLTISGSMTSQPLQQASYLSSQQNPLNGKPSTSISGGIGSGHVPPECSPAELSRKLQDHLVYQEQEIEFNRMKLAELDKELAALELACMESSELEARLSHQSSELQELKKVDWSTALSTERQLSVRLKSERGEWERRIRDTEANLDESRRRLERLETELVIERERQLAYLDAANQAKKAELVRLEAEMNNMTLTTSGGSPLVMRRTNIASSVAQRPASAQGGASAPGLWV